MTVNSGPWLKPAEIVSQIADGDAEERRHHTISLRHHPINKRLL
ncbi:MAG: hypothetical protein ACK5D0_12085 [Burkholderiaceae bacterium]|jgi:hypothetical protein